MPNGIDDFLSQEENHDIHELHMKLEAVQAERDKLRADLKSCSCAFCGATISNGGPGDRDRIREHVSQCESHPLYAIVKDRDAIAAERDALKARLDRVVESLNPGEPPCDCEACDCGNLGNANDMAVWRCNIWRFRDAKAIAEGRDDE